MKKVRLSSYFELNPAAVNRLRNKYKIHRFAQLYKDAYELQRYFIQKRDELCKNGEFILSGALSYKLSSLDSHVTSLIGSLTQSFDESEALLVESRYTPLESELNSVQASSGSRQHSVVKEGDFYYIDRSLIVDRIDKITAGEFPHASSSSQESNLIICVLKVNSDSSKFIAQVYLRPSDDQFIDVEVKKLRKFFAKEIFKSDLYALLDTSEEVTGSLKPCFVMGMKDFLNNEPTFDASSPSDEPDAVVVSKSDIFVCESLYSTCFRYFRKIILKKWCPLAFVNGTVSNPTVFNFSLTKRSFPLTSVSRAYLNESLVEQISREIEARVSRDEPMKIRQFFRDVQYDTPPAAALQASKEKDADEVDANAVDEDPELMKTAKYYEQLVYQRTGEIYKLGDFIYVKYQQLAGSNDPSLEHKHPLIVRIDRLWSTTTQSPEDPSAQAKNYYFRGPLFLRPTDVAHEPTRLFYKSEVIKEITRQITGSIDQIVAGNTGSGSTKCVVMNMKSYVSSRLTEIDERDVYLCESKYSMLTKAFRKGTKGLKKFDLSGKCNEDEIFFLRRELQLRKQLSPLLVGMDINYNEEYVKVSKIDFEDRAK
jgi:protein polybromo-1